MSALMFRCEAPALAEADSLLSLLQIRVLALRAATSLFAACVLGRNAWCEITLQSSDVPSRLRHRTTCKLHCPPKIRQSEGRMATDNPKHTLKQVGGQFFKTYWDGKQIPEDTTPTKQPKQTQAVIKGSSSPILAGIIGSVLGLMYGAGS